MGKVTWTLEADFTLDGSWATDLSAYVQLPGRGVALSRGIGRDGQHQITKFSVALSNLDGEFSPKNWTSPFYGKLDVGVPIRLTATHNAAPYTLCTAYATEWKTVWAKPGGISVCYLECQDIIWFLKDGTPINIVASTTRDTDAALTEVATALGFDVADYSFADGVQALPMHFAIDENPLEAFRQIVASEMGGLFYPAATGELKFEARNTRLGTTVDDTWGAGTAIRPSQVEHELNAIERCTSVKARSTVFRSGQADIPIFMFSQNMFTKPTATSMYMTAGQVWERTFSTDSAYLALTTLEAGYDYLANAAQDGSGADRTSSLTPTITDLGSGKFTLRLVAAVALYVTKFIVRGQPVEFFADRAEATFSLAMTGFKGGKELSIEVPFAGDTGGKLRDYAYQELRVGRYAWAPLRLTFICDTDAKRAAMLAADLGQRIAYADDDLAAGDSPQVNDTWYIEALQYQIPPNWDGRLFTCTVTLIESLVYRDLDAIVFDLFDRADASGDLGTSFSEDVWANDSGFDIVSGSAEPTDGGTYHATLGDLGVGKTDQIVEVHLSNLTGGGSNEQNGVVLRYTDSNNLIRAYVDDQNNVAAVVKVVAGTPTTLTTAAWTPTTTAELRASIQDDRIRFWVDGLEVIDETDASLPSGTKVGIYASAAAGTKYNHFYGQALN